MRLRLLRHGKPVDLRFGPRVNNPFWEYFSQSAFSRHEMELAIDRRVRTRTVCTRLIQSLGQHPQVPREVGDEFKRLFEAFDQVTMGICCDPACGDVDSKHAHAYRQAAVIKGATFRTTDQARAWLVGDHGRSLVDGPNTEALKRRIRDWPGMPCVSRGAPRPHP